MGTQASGHTIYLLRHAKSSWEEPLPDHERPLSTRGLRDARAVGQLLAVRGWRPDLVLCSTSTRTRGTWQGAHAAGAEAGAVRYVEEIYGASATELLGLLRATAEDVGSLLLIGHAPGMPDLADSLGRRPEPSDAWARMDAKFPTAGLAAVRIAGSWSAAAPNEAELVAFEVPRG